MNEIFKYFNMKAIFDWIKANWIISLIAVIIIPLLIFPRFVKKVFGGTTRRRRRALPRSVGVRRRRTTRPRKQYTKGGKAKKAWQIKGSPAARRHMARIRSMR